MEATTPTRMMVRNIDQVFSIQLTFGVGAFAEYCLAKGDLGMKVGHSSRSIMSGRILMQ